MKRLITSIVGLMILFAACKKNQDSNPCPNLGQEQSWKKYDGNPVFAAGQKSWDDGIILGHSVIKRGNTFSMWYSGGHDIFGLSIGYASSTDGLNWTRSTANPVLQATPGTWDELGVSIPVILKDGHTLHMWYLGGQYQ